VSDPFACGVDISIMWIVRLFGPRTSSVVKAHFSLLNAVSFSLRLIASVYVVFLSLFFF